MKKKFKKLSLNTETLRTLEAAELPQVAGGSVENSGCTVACSVCTAGCTLCTFCPTVCPCP